MTLEDPIEYRLPYVRQMQVRDDFSFSDGIRSILRQDPDVLLVGEIRDEETARLAAHAVLTGHKVFATVHGGNVRGVFSRLGQLSLSRDLLCTTVKAVVNQRLVRRLCLACRQVAATDTSTLPLSRSQPLSYVMTGCAQCHMTGFQGARACAGNSHDDACS